VLHCKYRTPKIVANLPSGHHHTTLSGMYRQSEKKLVKVKQQYLLHISPPYGELRLTSSGDRSGSFGHPSKFQRVSRLGSITARYSSSGRQPNFAALDRWRHLYLAGRPSRWASAHILVFFIVPVQFFFFLRATVLMSDFLLMWSVLPSSSSVQHC